MSSKTYSAKGDDKETSFVTDYVRESSEGHYNEHVCKDHNIHRFGFYFITSDLYYCDISSLLDHFHSIICVQQIKIEYTVS
jgi:hypothetical protein